MSKIKLTKGDSVKLVDADNADVKAQLEEMGYTVEVTATKKAKSDDDSKRPNKKRIKKD